MLAAQWGVCGQSKAAHEDRVVFDFETRTLEGWRIVEGSFFKPVGDRIFLVSQPKVRYNKPLRQAIEDLIATFGDRYPKGPDFLARLDRLERQAPETSVTDLTVLRREALLANPLVSGRPILFVTRPQYRSHYHAIDTLFHTGELNWDRQRQHADLFGPGGSMKAIDLKTGRVTTLYNAPDGIVRDPEIVRIAWRTFRSGKEAR